MTTFPLQLRPLPDAAVTAVAWFIPGADPAAWLDEISRWGVPMGEMRLFILPRSLRDRTAAGALVTGAEGVSRENVERGQAYQRLANRLYLPADATLDPPVSDEELAQKLIWRVNVLHPSIGLVGYRSEESIGVVDLLAPPALVEADWDRLARPIGVAPRLLSVAPEQPPTIELLIQRARDDIGSESSEELPPTEEESALKDALRRAGKPGLQMLQWLASGAAGGESWMSQLGHWAKQQLHALRRASDPERLRELRRLQKLFETNVDEALRFALPLRDTGSRGIATPGNRLGARDTTFNLKRLGGGRPADPWAVPDDTRRDLIAKYRAAANRELNLGRYRRAAYIFAELLGDYAAAANALQQGRFFREAATLYTEKLNNKPAAARCLRDGGLLAEAVVLFEELGEHVEAAELYAKLDRPEDARRCYREAVDRAIRRDAILDAAKLLETKLDAPDEAAALLLRQWPGSRGAATCLGAYFDLLSRRGEHEESRRRVTLLRDTPLPDERVEPLAEILSRLGTSHPDASMRALSADATRVVAGRRLAHATGLEAKSLVASVTRLNPEDRLLRRDGTRYLDRGPEVYKLAPLKPKSRLVTEFRLPGGIKWKVAGSTGETFFALGQVGAGRVRVLRGLWSGITQLAEFKGARDAEACFITASGFARDLLVIPARGPSSFSHVKQLRFPVADTFAEACQVGVPAWLPDQLVPGVGRDEDETIWIAYTKGDPSVTLGAYRAGDGQLLSTLGPVEVEARPPDGQFIGCLTPIVARRGHVFMSWGRGLYHWKPSAHGPSAQPRSINLSRPVLALAASPAFAGVRVAAALDEGGMVIWPEATQQPFGQGMREPKVAFTRGGLLVAVAGGEARVYRTEGYKVQLQCSFPVPDPSPIAVLPARKLEEIGLISADGLVRVFDVAGAQ